MLASHTAPVKYRLLCVGRVRERYVAEAIADFLERLQRYEPMEVIETAAFRGSDSTRAVREESDAILRRLGDEPVWLLERSGTQLSSVELSARLQAIQHAGTPRLTLVIAGTFGASDALQKRADFRWSLSALTFLHEWARALVLEQLYRAQKIARNEPYHH